MSWSVRICICSCSALCTIIFIGIVGAIFYVSYSRTINDEFYNLSNCLFSLRNCLFTQKEVT